MVRISNIVASAELSCAIDLRGLALKTCNIRYHHGHHNVAIWQHKAIGGNCFVYASGKLVCNGYASSRNAAIVRLRRYARKIQNLGYPVVLRKARILTVSMVHALNRRLRLGDIPGARYEPEFFPGAVIAVEHVRLTCFHTGKIVISGIRRESDLNRLVFPKLLELEIL